MLDLIKKDISASRYFIIGMLIVVPFVVAIGVSAMVSDFGGVFIGIFMVMGIGLSLAASFIFMGTDAGSQADQLLVSLPIRRRTIVLARYISSFMMAVGCYLLIVLTCFILVFYFNLSDPIITLMLSFSGITGVIFMLFFILAFILPFVFKFGPGGGAAKALFVYVGFLMLLQVVKFLFDLAGGHIAFDFGFIFNLLNSIVERMIELRAITGYLIVIAFFGMIVSVSIKLSIWFYQNRDL